MDKVHFDRFGKELRVGTTVAYLRNKQGKPPTIEIGVIVRCNAATLLLSTGDRVSPSNTIKYN